MVVARRSIRRRLCGAAIDAAAVSMFVALCWSSSSSHVLARHVSNLSAFAYAGSSYRLLTPPKWLCRDNRKAVIRKGTTVEDLIKSRLVPTTKQNRYQYMVDPKLRSFVATTEYKRVVQLLVELKKAGELESLLRKLDEYWVSLDIFRIGQREREGGAGLQEIVRRDWKQIWPSSQNCSQKEAFKLFSGFWKRLDQSRLFDDALQDVLPEFKRRATVAAASYDRERLSKLTNADREAEFLRRMDKVDAVQQYVKLIKDDEDVQYLKSDLTPAIAKFISSLEKKTAKTAVVEVGTEAIIAFFVAVVVAFAYVLNFQGLITLPSFEDDSLPPASVRTIKEPEVNIPKKFNFNFFGAPPASTQVPEAAPPEGEATTNEAPQTSTKVPDAAPTEGKAAIKEAPPATGSELTSTGKGRIRIAGTS